jgi:AAA+ superfamily predicted ATPase
MAQPGDAPLVSFAELDGRIRRGIEQVARPHADPADPFRGLYVSDEHARELAAIGPPTHLEERLGELSKLLGLDRLEQSLLAVCAAPEVTWQYGRLYGYLHDDLTRQFASPRLAAALLAGDTVSGEEVLDRLGADATLRQIGAIELLDDPRLPLADRPLKCGDAVAAYLVGGVAPLRSDTLAELVPIPVLAPAADAAIAELREVLRAAGSVPVAVIGSDAAAAIACASERPVLRASALGIEQPGLMPGLWLRAALGQAVLAIDDVHKLPPEGRAALWRALGQAVHWPVLCVDPLHETAVLGLGPVTPVRLPPIRTDTRQAAWTGHLPNAATEEVASKFRLSISQIEQAAQLARARAQSHGRTVPSRTDLDYGARGASRHQLEGLALRVEGEFTWADLIVPENVRRGLAMIAQFLRHRDRVLSDPAYVRTVGPARGMTVLFAGESGTGKTMAAQIVADDLGLELFRIDLATVVSKFIGETEKQLDRIFTAAAGSNAILLFDEADALFGKRSEVHDAHDRYANVEVAYLLQRIEGYDGAVILTTNLRRNIDQAFVRRLDLVVEFPFPEEEDRIRLWQARLPADLPLDEEDLRFLGRFKLSGGSVRNTSVSAALMAAEDGGLITMDHLARAIALEYDKLGRLTLEADFGSFYDTVRPNSSAS